MDEAVILNDALALVSTIPAIESAIGNLRSQLSGDNLAQLDAAIVAQKAKAKADVAQAIADLSADAAK